MAKPKFLYDNRLLDATPVASSTAVGDFNVLNLRDWRPFTWWKPSSMPATVAVDAGVPRTADYALLYGLFDAVIIEASDTDISSGYQSIVSSNLIRQSEAIGQSPWADIATPVVTENAGTSSFGVVWTKIEDNSGADFEGRQQAITVLNDSGQYRVRFWVKKTSGGTSKTVALNWNLTGGTSVSNNLRVNSDTGLVLGGAATVADWGDAWLCTASLSNNSSGNTSLTVQLFPATAVHNSGTDDATQTGAAHVGGFHVEIGPKTLAYLKTPASLNKLVLLPFTSESHRFWRIRCIDAAAPSLAIAAIGAALEAPVYFEGSFSPIDREVHGHTNRNEDGHALGRVVMFESWQSQILLKNVSWSWARDTFRPAWKAHLRGAPFGFIWDSDLYPGDVLLVAAGSKLAIPHRAGSRCDVQLDVEGVAP